MQIVLRQKQGEFFVAVIGCSLKRKKRKEGNVGLLCLVYEKKFKRYKL